MTEAKTAQPKGRAPQNNAGEPAGNAPSAEEATDMRKAELAARETAAKADAKTAAAGESIAHLQPVGLGPRPTHDVIGRKLHPTDDAKRREQQREATLLRQKRVEEDVDRVNRGLPPKYAVTDLED